MINAKQFTLPEDLIPKKGDPGQKHSPSKEKIKEIASVIGREQDKAWPHTILKIPGYEKRYFIETVFVKKEAKPTECGFDILWRVTPSSGHMTQFPVSPGMAVKLIWLDTAGEINMTGRI